MGSKMVLILLALKAQSPERSPSIVVDIRTWVIGKSPSLIGILYTRNMCCRSVEGSLLNIVEEFQFMGHMRNSANVCSSTLVVPPQTWDRMDHCNFDIQPFYPNSKTRKFYEFLWFYVTRVSTKLIDFSMLHYIVKSFKVNPQLTILWQSNMASWKTLASHVWWVYISLYHQSNHIKSH